MRRHCLLAALLLATASSPVFADDWTVTRLRGGVFTWNGTSWDQLQRGSVVSDERIIRSNSGGRATFVRDAETIEVLPGTTIQIDDSNGFTTVYNREGTVGIDAEVQNVQHFAVKTPMLAAVVKGTAFVVRNVDGVSTVAVTRGEVEVNDKSHSTTAYVQAGEQVSSGSVAITAASVVTLGSELPAPPPPVAAPTTSEPVVVQAAPTATLSSSSEPSVVAPSLAVVVTEEQNPADTLDGGNGPGRGRGPKGEAGPPNGPTPPDRPAPGSGGGHDHEEHGSPGERPEPPRPGSGGPGKGGPNPHGHDNSGPGNSDNAPGHDNSGPGNSENAPGHNKGGKGKD